MELSEQEKKAIKELNHYINITEFWKQKEYTNSEIDNYIKIVLNSFEKQQKEIEEEHKKWKELLHEYGVKCQEIEEYTKFKKDIVDKIMIWDKEELPDNDAIISMLDTFKAEVLRLEDIEDKKVMVEIGLIEEKRDKFWKDKIKNKIEQLKEIADEDNPDIYIKIDAYKELLEENDE